MVTAMMMMAVESRPWPGLSPGQGLIARKL